MCLVRSERHPCAPREGPNRIVAADAAKLGANAKRGAARGNDRGRVVLREIIVGINAARRFLRGAYDGGSRDQTYEAKHQLRLWTTTRKDARSVPERQSRHRDWAGVKANGQYIISPEISVLALPALRIEPVRASADLLEHLAGGGGDVKFFDTDCESDVVLAGENILPREVQSKRTGSTGAFDVCDRKPLRQGSFVH